MQTPTPVERILGKDSSFWSADTDVKARIQDRLGWLDAMAITREQEAAIDALSRQIKQRGIRHVLLLGMGGSILAPEVFARIAGSSPGYPRMITLDSTSPDQVRAIRNGIIPRETLVIVSSKSGSTIETLSLYRYFFNEYQNSGVETPAEWFVAITDPSSVLQREAEGKGFLACFLNDPNIGGRFSALSLFGIVPAALTGVEIGTVLDAARQARDACEQGNGDGVLLGEWLTSAWVAGRDKLGLVLPPQYEALGWWIEQLVAESLGKDGKGVLPYICDSRERALRDDGMCVDWKNKHRPAGKRGEWVQCLEIGDVADLGSHFFHWEFATALAGGLMGLNPFDEPDVAAAKENTARLLEKGGLRQRLADRADREKARTLLDAAGPRDYVALLAYLPQLPGRATQRLTAFKRDIEEHTGLPVSLCWGPRYLHSVGQYHKGGPGNGVFLMIVGDTGPDVPVPGTNYDFATLLAAQALGDLQALEEKGRLVSLIVEDALPILFRDR